MHMENEFIHYTPKEDDFDLSKIKKSQTLAIQLTT